MDDGRNRRRFTPEEQVEKVKEEVSRKDAVIGGVASPSMMAL